jgi:lipopolysaccharide transport system ATP-binding protein
MNQLSPHTAIRAEGLGKRYRIGLRLEEDQSLFASIARVVTSPARNFRDLRRLRVFGVDSERVVIWALRDLSFEAQKGEVLGIVGRNGAGKSTLLKILTRVTRPTTGIAQIRGRSTSLLEVGTGFHRDLTGRENIYLNGTMHGMTRREIGARFDRIVEFAEIEQLIDTPVKRYSSGMYVRLAFSVAAHLEPDVLLTDEVLAVGDAEFQKKCLGRMREVAGGGRTVVFVSHNRAAIASLCTRALWLDGGLLREDGEVDSVLSSYYASLVDPDEMRLAELGRRGDGRLRITGVRFLNRNGDPVAMTSAGEDLVIAVRYQAADERPIPAVTAMIFIDSGFGGRIATLSNQFTGESLDGLSPFGELLCTIPRLPLNEGIYVCSFKIKVAGALADYIPDAVSFTVEASRFYSTRRHPTRDSGPLLLEAEWGASETSESVGSVLGEHSAR